MTFRPSHAVSIRTQEIIVYVNVKLRFWAIRDAKSFRHAVKNRDFPAENERLITRDELLRYGAWARTPVSQH